VLLSTEYRVLTTFPPVHPFLPVTAIIFLLIADGVMIFLRLNGGRPDLATHIAPLNAIVLASLVFGGGTAFWLRRFGLRYPSWIAVLSLLLLALLRLL
jgi:hypothetical protein